MEHDGGSITERHIFYALVKKLIGKYGKGQPLLDFYRERYGHRGKGAARGMLLDTD